MHFVARCTRYPEFGLNVHELRQSYDARGKHYDATVIHFRDGVYDSQEEGLTESEAGMVLAALKRCTIMPPMYGHHILVTERPPEPVVVDLKKGRIS